MSTAFCQHGVFSNRTQGQLLISQVVGPWNLELVQAWSKDCYIHGLALSQRGPWVFIGIVVGSMVCPPEAFAEMKRGARYGVKHLHCCAHFLVAGPDVEGRYLMEGAYTSLYQDLGTYQLLDTLEEAEHAAQQHLNEANGTSKKAALGD